MITINEAALLLNITGRRVRTLCAAGRIKGAKKQGRDWLLPNKPIVTPGKRGPAFGQIKNEEQE